MSVVGSGEIVLVIPPSTSYLYVVCSVVAITDVAAVRLIPAAEVGDCKVVVSSVTDR